MGKEGELTLLRQCKQPVAQRVLLLLKPEGVLPTILNITSFECYDYKREDKKEEEHKQIKERAKKIPIEKSSGKAILEAALSERCPTPSSARFH